MGPQGLPGSDGFDGSPASGVTCFNINQSIDVGTGVPVALYVSDQAVIGDSGEVDIVIHPPGVMGNSLYATDLSNSLFAINGFVTFARLFPELNYTVSVQVVKYFATEAMLLGSNSVSINTGYDTSIALPFTAMCALNADNASALGEYFQIFVSVLGSVGGDGVLVTGFLTIAQLI